MNRCEEIDLVVWDFDGVLNRNIIDGRFVWANRLHEDLGVTREQLAQGLFSEMFPRILVGEVDLRDHLAACLQTWGSDRTADEVLEYWFSRDDLRDRDLLARIDSLRDGGVRCVIGTNNEVRRAQYIWERMQMCAHFDEIYAAGPLGLAKPDPRFFKAIEEAENVSVPEHVMFVDDSALNVEVARQLGWNAIHYTSSAQTAAELDELFEALLRSNEQV